MCGLGVAFTAKYWRYPSFHANAVSKSRAPAANARLVVEVERRGMLLSDALDHTDQTEADESSTARNSRLFNGLSATVGHPPACGFALPRLAQSHVSPAPRRTPAPQLIAE